jgi:hypothetical protein
MDLGPCPSIRGCGLEVGGTRQAVKGKEEKLVDVWIGRGGA